MTNTSALKRNRTTSTMLECYYNSRLIGYLVLHDKFGFGQKRIVRLENAVDKYLDDYSNNLYETGYFEDQLKMVGVDIREIVNQIPSRVKMLLTYGDNIPRKILRSDLITITSSLYTFFAITIYAMNHDLKISINKIKSEYLKWMQFNFKCLSEKNRLCIYDVVLVMADECGYLDHRYEKGSGNY